MSSGNPENKHWYLDLSASTYAEEDNFIREDGQTQAQYNSTYNQFLVPDEALDLELDTFIYFEDHSTTDHYAMPDYGVSPSSQNAYHTNFAQSTCSSPKHVESDLSTTEELNPVRNQRLIVIKDLLSKIDTGIALNSSGTENKPSNISNVAQSLSPITSIGSEEWPVPRFFLDPKSGSTPPDDFTSEKLESGPRSPDFPQSQCLEYAQTNDYCSMAEDMDSVPPIDERFDSGRARSISHYKVFESDSGLGTSTMSMSYRHGPQSIVASSYKYTQSRRGGKASTRGSLARESVMIEKGSVSGFNTTNTGKYKQVAAKFGPLTSAASSTARSVERPRMLSETALKTMKTIILEPILGDEKFRDFWYICTMAGEQMESGQIGALRDLEKFLFHKASNIKNNQAYNNFCKEFLNHVRESLRYMPEDELLRSYDRPYDSGYFLDIMFGFDKDTIPPVIMGIPEEDEEDAEFRNWLNCTKTSPKKRLAEEPAENDYSVERVKAGRSLSTVPVNFNLLSNARSEYESSASILFNGGSDITSEKPGLMGPPPRPTTDKNPPMRDGRVKLAKSKSRKQGPDQGPQSKKATVYHCGWQNACNVKFTRRCDWTKHRKTHERPHKCTVADCKYALEGFPTEKERDRHWTDKHCQETPNYLCHYPPCTYKSKRDSNCKQHMEKAHGYHYVRTKQNQKAKGVKRQRTSSTSPERQSSPTGTSQNSHQIGYLPQPLPISDTYQATDYQHVPAVSSQNGTDQGPTQSIKNLEEFYLLYPHPNGDSGQQDHYTLMGNNQERSYAAGNFDPQSYTTQNDLDSLPYPTINSSFLTLTPTPDGNIDPALQVFMNFDEEHNLIQYSNMVT